MIRCLSIGILDLWRNSWDAKWDTFGCLGIVRSIGILDLSRNSWDVKWDTFVRIGMVRST